MALVQNNLTLAYRIQNLRRPPNALAADTLLPRALVTALVSGTIAAQGAADTTAVLCTINLGGEFAYRHHSTHALIDSTTSTNDYELVGRGLAANWNPHASNSVQLGFNLVAPGYTYDFDGNKQIIYRAVNPPNQMLMAPAGQNLQVTHVFSNINAGAQPQMSIFFSAQYLQYDQAQYYSSVPHTPIPVVDE